MLPVAVHAAMEPSASGREMSTDITHFAIKNKGIKAGPGGRSSVRCMASPALPTSHTPEYRCMQVCFATCRVKELTDTLYARLSPPASLAAWPIPGLVAEGCRVPMIATDQRHHGHGVRLLGLPGAVRGERARAAGLAGGSAVQVGRDRCAVPAPDGRPWAGTWRSFASFEYFHLNHVLIQVSSLPCQDQAPAFGECPFGMPGRTILGWSPFEAGPPACFAALHACRRCLRGWLQESCVNCNVAAL